MYFGSVRFFKNLILLVIIILIAIPAVCAIRLSGQLSRQKEETARTDLALEEATTQLADARKQLTDTQQRLDLLEAEVKAAQDAAASLAPDQIYYQSLYPDFYAPQEYQATGRSPGTIYLTFDDGPSANTAAILDALDEAGVKATFFVLGQTNEDNLQRMKLIVERGHTIGMHSWSHNYGEIYTSVEAFLEDMYKVFTQIRETTGVTPTFFRCPGGSINGYSGGIYKELLAEMMRRGFVPCDWNMSAEDAVTGTLDAGEIVENVLRSVDRVSSGFVLMHDSARLDSTVEALPDIIRELRDRGFQFASLTPDVKPVLFTYKN